ncbi:hypothetical protein [Streptomyces sp. MBT27]|uniref:hypothetical protein n=1 Tax=Streptomyces sp. MBT27 TaxID=1488356 RepID=UPI0014204149|nr:hypothetical protein [Streptomyces sp. MBT27]
MSTPPVASLPQFPVQPPVPGYGPPPMTMPGRVKAMRIVLFILGGFNTAGGALILLGAVLVSAYGDSADRHSAPLLYAVAAAALLMATATITLGIWCAHGGNRTRIGVIVVGALLAANYLLGLFNGQGLSGPGLAAATYLIATAVGADAKAWFNRPGR